MIDRREVLSRGNRISYRVDGAGPPLLLLCGLSQWCDQWFDAGYVDALRHRWTVIAVDRLGHGNSDKPHDPDVYRERDIVTDLVAVLDVERVDAAVAWGFSLGAKNAASLAALRPERVRALVHGSSASLADDPAGYVERNAAVIDLLRMDDGLKTFWAFVGFTDEDAVREGLAHNDADALACALAGSMTWFPTAAEITVPSLWYLGEAEGEFSDAEQDHASANGIELHVVPGADHFQAFNRSAEVLRFVEPFLDRTRP